MGLLILKLPRQGTKFWIVSYYEQPRLIPVVFAVEGIQKGQGETMQHLIDMDVDPELMLYSLNTPPDQIYALVEDELTSTRIATQIRQ